MSSTEIVKLADTLPSREEVEAQLDALETSGDTQTLNEIANQARAFQEYERRQSAAERANYFGRVKVMAEARIGSIDLDLHPRVKGSVLELNGETIPRSQRSQWRMLAAGLMAGQLDKAIALTEERRESIHTTAVTKELRHIGAPFVWTAPLLERYQELFRREGLTLIEVERRAGVPTVRHFLTRPGTVPQFDKTARHIALRVAATLGADASMLKSAPMHRKPSGRPRPRRVRKLTGGRLDETYSLIRKALQELDRAAPGGRWGTDEAWAHLYAAEEIVGKALCRAPIK